MLGCSKKIENFIVWNKFTYKYKYKYRYTIGNSLTQDNLLTQEQIQERTDNVANINKLEFDILYIGNRLVVDGCSLAIPGIHDFIEQYELKYKCGIMKGQDIMGRNFFVFKSIFKFEDGSEYKIFSSFFQSYPNDNLHWHCTGRYGLYIMNTGGGISNEQLKFIFELLTEHYVQLDKKKCDELRLYFRTPKQFKSPKKYPHSVEIDFTYNLDD